MAELCLRVSGDRECRLVKGHQEPCRYLCEVPPVCCVVPADSVTIPAGTEREHLLVAILAHAAAAQSWDHRKRMTAVEHILECFDAMAKRLQSAPQIGAIDPAIVDRIRSSYESARARRYLAVNLDMELVLAVLTAIDMAAPAVTP